LPRIRCTPSTPCVQQERVLRENMAPLENPHNHLMKLCKHTPSGLRTCVWDLHISKKFSLYTEVIFYPMCVILKKSSLHSVSPAWIQICLLERWTVVKWNTETDSIAKQTHLTGSSSLTTKLGSDFEKCETKRKLILSD
jgi:hypothetical protein